MGVSRSGITWLDTLQAGADNPAMATLSARLADVQLPDPDGKQVRLGDLWMNRPAVIAFLRHYG